MADCCATISPRERDARIDIGFVTTGAVPKVCCSVDGAGGDGSAVREILGRGHIHDSAREDVHADRLSAQRLLRGQAEQRLMQLTSALLAIAAVIGLILTRP